MQNIIKHCSHFTAKLDCELLKTLCQQHNEPVSDRIVYSFLEKHYDDLDKDSKADQGIIATLKEQNSTVANVLVDHLNIHIMSIHLGKHFEQCKYYTYYYLTDPDNRAMDDYDDLLTVESSNGYNKWRILYHCILTTTLNRQFPK